MVSFNGKPLLVNNIEMAKQIDSIDKIYLSTDSEEMADLASSYGVFIIKRPTELASDDSQNGYLGNMLLLNQMKSMVSSEDL